MVIVAMMVLVIVVGLVSGWWIWDNERKYELASRDEAYQSALNRWDEKLTLARRALARGRERGMTDEEMAEAFESLLENQGFEAILQLLTDQSLAAVDRMTEDGLGVLDMKKAAGAVDALSNLQHRLIELEEQAKTRRSKAA